VVPFYDKPDGLDVNDELHVRPSSAPQQQVYPRAQLLDFDRREVKLESPGFQFG
jgi:hypothetical protein